MKLNLLTLLLLAAFFSRASYYTPKDLKEIKSSLTQEESKLEIARLLQLADAYQLYQLDSAEMYATKAMQLSLKLNYSWGIAKANYYYTSIVLENQSINKLGTQLSPSITWFHSQNYTKDWLQCWQLNTKIKKMLLGEAAVRLDAENILLGAQKLGDDEVLGNAWLDMKFYENSMMKERKYPYALDSARYYFMRIKDSVKMMQIDLFETLPVNGGIKSLAVSYNALRWSETVKIPLINYMVYDRLILDYSSGLVLDSALFYANKAILIADQINSKRSRFLSLKKKAYSYKASKKIESSIQIATNLLDEVRPYHYNDLISDLSYEIASRNILIKNYEVALPYTLEALKLKEKEEDVYIIFVIKRLLANIYTTIGEYELANSLYYDYENWAEKSLNGMVKTKILTTLYSEMGDMYIAYGDTTNAIRFYEKSIETIGRKSSRYSILPNVKLINTYLQQKEFDKADSLYHRISTVNGAESLGFSDDFQLITGRMLIEKKEYKKAIQSLNKFLILSDSLAINPNNANVYYHLYTAHKSLHNYQDALNAYTRHEYINAELEKVAFNKVAEVKNEYEIKLKESNISSLKREQVLQSLKILNQEDQLKFRTLYLLLFILLALLIGLYLFKREQSKKEKEKLEITKKAEILKFKNQLYENISHEFRTPLTLIRVPVQNYLPKIAEQDQSIFENVIKHTDELLDLLDDLLEVKPLEEQKIRVQFKEINFSKLLLHVVKPFSELFKNKGILFSFDSTISVNQVIYGDEKKIKIVLKNVLKNAYHHTEKEGAIALICGTINENGEEKIRVQIKNQGKVIKAVDLNQLFNRTFRSNENRYKGNGIGLSVSKEIMAEHDGDITVNLNKSGWVGFLIEFPLQHKLSVTTINNESVTEEKELLPSKEKSLTRGGKKEKTVLLVEDNSNMSDLIKGILMPYYNVVTAENGEIGLKLAQEKQPDLILSDIMMPVMDGYRLAEMVRTDVDTSHIPILFLTAKSDKLSEIKGFDSHADGYLTKPFDAKVLLARVDNLLRNRAQLQKAYKNNPVLLVEKIECTQLDKAFLEKAYLVLEANFENGEFGVADFCSAMLLNRNSVHNKIKAFTGQNTSHFMKTFRVEKAAHFLLESNETINAIYVDCGFNNSQTFNKVFKERYHVSPKEFREKNSSVT